MNNLARRVCVLLWAAMVLCSRLPAADRQWVEVRSPNFVVLTDAGEKRGRETAMRFEQMRTVFSGLFAKLKVNLPVPLQIVAFQDTREIRGFAPLWQGKPVENAGLFLPGDDRAFILLDLSTEACWQTIFHEYAHQLINGNMKEPTALWFEEGFAEYFSTTEVEEHRAKVGASAPLGSVQVLREHGIMKVSDLFRVRHDSPAYNTGLARDRFYAASWLVMEYLYDRQLVAKTGAYFTAVASGKTVEEAVKQAFGISVAELDQELQRYLNANLVRYYSVPMPGRFDSSGYVVRAVNELDRRAALADVHLHSYDHAEKAVDQFAAILKENPDHPAALRGMGYACLRRQELERAREYFEKATRLDPNDARGHYYYASLLLSTGVLASEPDKIDALRDHLEKAITLDPNLADAYQLLAMTCGSTADHEGEIRNLKRALDLSPRNERYLFSLAQAYFEIQQFDQATAILRSLGASSFPGMAENARMVLRQIQQAIEEAREPRIPAASAGAPAVTVANPVPAAASAEPIIFLKGKLLNVDCSNPPAASLTVTVGAEKLKIQVANRDHLVLLGADAFSCDWVNIPVAVNYRETAPGQRNLVSLEIQ